MALNGISTLESGDGSDPVATKILRREEKLALAETKRSTTSTNGYRTLNDITGTHMAYVGTATVLVSGSSSPTIGHPWS